MTSAMRALFASLPPAAELVDARSADAVRRRSAEVLRPDGALAALDEIAIHLGRWQHTRHPGVRRPAVLIFAADHGVAAAGVSNYPSSITASMLAAVRQGRATVNAMAAAVGATVNAYDVGVGRPTGDIRFEPALTPARFDDVVETATMAVDTAVEHGADLLVLGELGIGNTTTAAALTAHFTGTPLDVAVGRGTGVDDDGLARKRAAVAAAVERCSGVTDPLEALRQLGGAELVAMAAAALRARQRRLPVLLDGYVVTAAMLPLHATAHGVLDHCLAGHASAEQGHRRVLEHLGLRPILALDLRLGEGTGALAALPLLELACRAVTDVATFAEWFADHPAPPDVG